MRTPPRSNTHLRRGLPAPLLLLLLLTALPSLRAAEFGVERAGPPPGYFVLVGDEAIQEGLTWALGDIPHLMTFYIEVPVQSRLTIDIYDPGLYNPAGMGGADQLDGSFSGTAYVGEMRFSLIDPMLNLIEQQSYAEDTSFTNQQLVRYFSQNNMDPGTYQLIVQLMDTAGTDEDFSVFGLSVPGFHVYSYNFCVGHNNAEGATITDPVALYPWINYSAAGLIGSFPTCGLDFVNYDLDADVHGVEPPSMRLVTQRGDSFEPPDNSPDPSANMSFWVDAVAEVTYGELDSNDQGIWRWEFLETGSIQDQVSPSLPQPYNLNAWSMQVYDIDSDFPMFQDWPFDPSFLIPLDDRHPRPIYLPQDDGSWPVKERIGHYGTVIAGENPILEGFQSTIEVTFEFANPREYPIQIVEGTTWVAPNPEFSDPVISFAGGNMTAAVNAGEPRRIDISGSVPAGATEFFTYTVDVTPSTPGGRLLTGNGTDFIGGTANQTRIVYNSPISLIYGDDQIGPICGIWFNVLDAVCTAAADLVATGTERCAHDPAPINLDGSGSTLNLCTGGNIQYRWLADGMEIVPWDDVTSSIDVTPTLTTTYTLEIRCSVDPADCTDSIDQVITVHPAPIPDIRPRFPRLCPVPGDSVTLRLENASDYQTWTWTTNPANEPGDGAVDAGTVDAVTIGAEYTVTATTDMGCSVANTVTVTERILQPPVIQPADPGICPGGALVRIEVVDPGQYDRCEWTTVPGGADGDGSADCFVDTNDAGVEYTVTVYDARGCSAQQIVTTRQVTDQVPPALGNVVRIAKQAAVDLRISWTDLPMPVGEYQILSIETDATGNPPPTPSNLQSGVMFTEAPGVGSYVEAGGQTRGDWLTFYKIRAASECFFTPGPL